MRKSYKEPQIEVRQVEEVCQMEVGSIETEKGPSVNPDEEMDPENAFSKKKTIWED